MKPPIAAVASALGLQVRRNRTTCPIHQGDNPQSLSFKRERATCFACGWSGDAIELIRTLEGASFPDALQRLGDLGFDVSSWDRPLPPRKPRRGAKPTPPSPDTIWREIRRESYVEEVELRALEGQIADGIRQLHEGAGGIRRAVTALGTDDGERLDLLRHAARLDGEATMAEAALDEVLAERQWQAWHADSEHAGAPV